MQSRLRISDFGFRIFLLLLPLAVAAQTPDPSAPTDNTLTVNVLRDRIGIGEIGQLFIKLRNAEATLPERIDATGLEILFSGQQSSVNIVNGAQSVETTYFYRFRGNEPGTYTIPEFEIRLRTRQGESVAKTRPLVVTIAENELSDSALDATKPYFGKLELKRDTFYVNELVPFTLTAYARGRNAINDVVSASLEHESFVIKGFREVRTDGAEVGNSYYSSAVIPSHLFALKPGSHRLGPAEIAVRVIDSGSGFGGLSSFFQRTATREMVTNTVNLTVKALPSDAPASFTGGVGSFELTAQPSTTSLGIGDPLTIEFEVSGIGNLRTMGAPVFTVPPTGIWKTYDARKKLEDDEDSDGFRAGKVRFSQVLIPEARTETIPEFQLSYFDPAKEQYVTLKAGPFPVTISQSSSPSSSASPAITFPAGGGDAAPAARRPEPAFADVLHIRTTPPRWIAADGIGKTRASFWIVQALLSAAFCTVAGFGATRWFAALKRRRLTPVPEISFSRAVKRLPRPGSSRREFFHAVAEALDAWRREHPAPPPRIVEALDRLSARCDTVLYSGQGGTDAPVSAAEAEECAKFLHHLTKR
mgnify:CR=1 FL=1